MYNSIRTSISFLREELADRRAPPRTKSLLPILDSSRTSEIGPAVSTSTLGLERDERGGSSSIVLSRQFDEEEGMSSSVLGGRSASELGKDEDRESIAMEELERDVKRKKTMKIKVETVAASELGAEPLPSGRRVYQ